MRRNDTPKNNRPNPSRPKAQTGQRPTTPPPPPKEDIRATAGPRPLSPQQRAYQNLIQGSTNAYYTPPAAPAPPVTSAERRVTARRDTTVARKRVVVNRRKRNYPRILLNIASVGLTIECVAFLLFSPRLAVQYIRVEGNRQVPTEQILAKANPLKGQNLVRFPVGTLHDALLKEPTIETLAVRRVWPDKVEIAVQERQPWAAVTTPDGASYTIDSKLVPFRKGTAPEKGLPHLILGQAPGRTAPISVVLGKKMTAPGLSEVSACLEWAKARPDFPMESVAIDSTGKLCFNRVGGTQVQLGSAMDLSRKLTALGLLMQRYNIADAAYVNLFAYDAPAVMPRSAVATASARTHPSNLSPSRHRLDRGEATDSTSELP